MTTVVDMRRVMGKALPIRHMAGYTVGIAHSRCGTARPGWTRVSRQMSGVRGSFRKQRVDL